MKTKAAKRAEAEARQKAADERTEEEQIALVRARGFTGTTMFRGKALVL